MKRIAMVEDWSKKKTGQVALQPALRRYRRYLEDRMLAASIFESHLNRVKLFLEWSGTDTPSTSSFDSY
jgi:hypothetical protein